MVSEFCHPAMRTMSQRSRSSQRSRRTTSLGLWRGRRGTCRAPLDLPASTGRLCTACSSVMGSGAIWGKPLVLRSPKEHPQPTTTSFRSWFRLASASIVGVVDGLVTLNDESFAALDNDELYRRY